MATVEAFVLFGLETVPVVFASGFRRGLGVAVLLIGSLPPGHGKQSPGASLRRNPLSVSRNR